ncbi:MAG: hypothetical protein AAGA54_32730 [Myxococcota bacterium]
MMRRIAPLFLLPLLAAACNDHEPVQAFRSAVLIGDRGISIPLPPPSVLQAPQQEVEVQGAVEGVLPAGAEVRLVDNEGGDETAAEVGAEGGFSATLEVNLTNSCIEAWTVDEDGNAGERRFFSTRVEADDSILVVDGCE